MASNHTSNYNLNQWSADDRVLRTDFNADNAKIDAALAGKASVTSLNSLQSAVSSLSQTVNQQGTTLTGKGNCQIYATTYVGNGLYGAENPRKLTFPGRPLAVLINGDNGFSVMLQGAAGTVAAFNASYPLTVTWSGNTVSWYHDGSARADGMLNRTGRTYQVIAFMEAG